MNVFKVSFRYFTSSNTNTNNNTMSTFCMNTIREALPTMATNEFGGKIAEDCYTKYYHALLYKAISVYTDELNEAFNVDMMCNPENDQYAFRQARLSYIQAVFDAPSLYSRVKLVNDHSQEVVISEEDGILPKLPLTNMLFDTIFRVQFKRFTVTAIQRFHARFFL